MSEYYYALLSDAGEHLCVVCVLPIEERLKGGIVSVALSLELHQIGGIASRPLGLTTLFPSRRRRSRCRCSCRRRLNCPY